MPNEISKNLALFLLKNRLINPERAVIVCKGFANDDGDFVEVIPEDLSALKEDNEYQHFEIWLNK